MTWLALFRSIRLRTDGGREVMLQKMAGGWRGHALSQSSVLSPASLASFLDTRERSHQLLDARADEGDRDFLVVAQIPDRNNRAITELGVRNLVSRPKGRAVRGGRWCRAG